MLKQNTKSPDFTARTHTGDTVQLSKVDAKFVILYFYPKDMTPGCTLQAREMNKHLDYFEEHNIKIFGISRDKEKAHIKFANECGLKFPLIVDEEKKICELYDVLVEKSMFGKKYMGVTRTTYIINPKEMKIVATIEKVNPLTHVENLKKIIEEIGLADNLP
jgi:thioredoxin-dependent peroxiredoxin